MIGHQPGARQPEVASTRHRASTARVDSTPDKYAYASKVSSITG